MSSVDHIPQRFPHNRPTARFRTLRSDIEKAFLAVERAVRVENEPFVGRVGGISPSDDERIVLRRRFLRKNINPRPGQSATRWRVVSHDARRASVTQN